MQEAVVLLIMEIVGAPNVVVREPMKKHTTFMIGGPADLFITPQTIQQLETVIKLLKQMKIPYFVMGNGSNLLVGDQGIRGAVIQLTGLKNCEICGNRVTAEAGILLSKLANTAMKNALSGLEFAAGIPGTLGGALYMNAGAYGGEMKDVVADVTYLDAQGLVQTIPGASCEFGYRCSRFQAAGEIILGCTLQLKDGDMAAIQRETEELNRRRAEKQPLNKPSAGSTFKRPEGHFAGKLIQDAALQGTRIGGAEVSEKHAGFIVNQGGATAADVRQLIAHVQKTVLDQFGVALEPEVKFIGEFE